MAQKSISPIPDSVKNDVVLLSKYLIDSTKTDKEKVANLYQWLIENISYDERAYKNGNKRINFNSKDILKRKKAICWGYASLFKEMCEIADIACEVISGYGRTAFGKKPNIERQNHAWNAVKIDGKWYLLDATWDSNSLENGNIFQQKYGYTYFLPPPNYFIVNHLPGDPNWQLLECPISPSEYQLSEEEIILLAKKTDCDNIVEIDSFANLPIQDKRLATAIKAYKYNPTTENKRELAHAHIDYEAYLSEIAEKLQAEQDYDSLLIIQKEMIQLCETATELTQLFDTQKENCAYNFFNYAVTLTQITSNEKKSDLQKWQEVLINLEKAQRELKLLPPNFFTKNALSHCADYIEYAKSNIEALK